MLSLGPLTFLAPLALLAIVLLPLLWWLLRLTPPTPLRVPFPPARLLALLASTEESSARTPPWLLALRLALALAVILAAAHPLLNAGSTSFGSGPLILIVDDGWAAARDWKARQAALRGLIDIAEREDRGVGVVTTAQRGDSEPVTATLQSAEQARESIEALQPKPWPVDRGAAVDALTTLSRAAGWQPGELVWLTDGLDEAAEGGFAALVARLPKLAGATVIEPEPSGMPVVLHPPERQADTLLFTVERPALGGELKLWYRAISDDGSLVARDAVRFAAGERQAQWELTLPSELLARLARVEIEGQHTAAAVVLIDERWRNRPVGLLTRGAEGDQPLLGDLYYVQRALEASGEVRKGTADALLARPPAVIVVADSGPLDKAAAAAITDWVEGGGVLLRFAGPTLAADPEPQDPLLPVKLRAGDRALGGAMSWRSPGRLAPFDKDSPFFGLAIPADVEVRRQVLAVPSVDLSERTWARLDDGTPLVTAVRRGGGWIILVHTTANADWSNLALSGLFVEMLERMIALSRGTVPGPAASPLAPIATLDGFGRLGAPSADALAIMSDPAGGATVGPRHPPGLYGEAAQRRALNLSAGLSGPRPLGVLPGDVVRRGYAGIAERDLRGWMLVVALVLAIIDLAASLVLRGLARLPGSARRRPVVPSLLLLVLVATGGPAGGQSIIADGTAVPASLGPRLAYVVTGNGEVDTTSRAGLAGLSAIVNRRTAADLESPVAVDPERDELAFYPILYWPLTAGQSLPSIEAAHRLKAYMRNGGTIVFDTRSRNADMSSANLRQFARVLDVPPLIPVPPDHVLSRAFYLLADYPGRWTGGTVWIEPASENVNDGVASVIAGHHDWAAAWAVDDAQRPLYAVVPGGERQREMAYRFGVNLVMHVLTGSYKADQVHLPAILERLGR